MLQGDTVRPQLDAARGEGDVVSLDPHVGNQVYARMVTGRRKAGATLLFHKAENFFKIRFIWDIGVLVELTLVREASER